MNEHQISINELPSDHGKNDILSADTLRAEALMPSLLNNKIELMRILSRFPLIDILRIMHVCATNDKKEKLLEKFIKMVDKEKCE